MSTTITTAYHTSELKKIPFKVIILISATSLVFSSLLSLLSRVMTTTKPDDQKVGKWGIYEKDF